MEIINEYNFKYTPHMILLSLIFFFKYFSKAREESQNLNPEKVKNANRIYYKYLICFQLAKAADWCLGPFMYEFFQSYHHLKTEVLAKLVALSFFSSLFMGPFIVGYLNDKSDKKLPCMIFGISLAISCLVRQIKNPGMLILGQVSYGLCSPLLYTSFENWFVGETNQKIEDKKIRENVIANAFENSLMIDGFMASLVSMITGHLKRTYGIQYPYLFSAVLSIISCILVGFLFDKIEKITKIKSNEDTPEKDENTIEPKHEVLDVLKNIKNALVVLKDNPRFIILGLTESLLFSILQIFIFIWSPIIKELKPDAETSEIFLLFMLSMMVGGTLFKALNHYFNSDATKIIRLLSFICFISFIVSNLRINYNYSLFAFMVYEMTIGMMYPSLSKIKSDFLPHENRGTIMNIFKIPLNIWVIFLLFSMGTYLSFRQLLFVNLCASLTAFILSQFLQYPPQVRLSLQEEIANLKKKEN